MTSQRKVNLWTLMFAVLGLAFGFAFWSLSSPQVTIIGEDVLVGRNLMVTDKAGIGMTSAPESGIKLQVEGGKVLLRGDILPFLSLDRTGNPNVTGVYHLGVSYGGGKDFLRIYRGTSELMVINQDGNVGIGTTGPAYKLDVAGDINIGAQNVYRRGGVAGISISCQAGNIPSGITISGGIVTLAGSCITIGDITGVNAGTGLTGGGTSGEVTLSADTTYLQRRVTGSCLAGNAIRVINADGTVTCEPIGGIGGSGTGNYLAKFTSATTIGNSQIYDTGTNVGIGTTSPGAKLHVASGLIETGTRGVRQNLNFVDSCGTTRVTRVHSGIWGPDYSGGCGDEWFIGVQDRDGGEASTLVIGMWNDANDHIALIGSGNVGIGTTAPAQRLHVAGNVRIDGALDVRSLGPRTLISVSVSGYGSYYPPAGIYYVDGDYGYYFNLYIRDAGILTFIFVMPGTLGGLLAITQVIMVLA